CQDLGLVNAIARLLQLDGTAACSYLRACRDEDFHVRVGKDDGSDVAAIEHGTGRGSSEIALEREHHAAHLRDRRDQRSRLTDGSGLERRLAEPPGTERPGAAAAARGS